MIATSRLENLFILMEQSSDTLLPFKKEYLTTLMDISFMALEKAVEGDCCTKTEVAFLVRERAKGYVELCYKRNRKRLSRWFFGHQDMPGILP